MIRFFLLLYFLFISVLSYAQDQTPIASFPFQSDVFYQNKIQDLKTQYSQNLNIKLLDSIISIAFSYKDWETSIVYSQKAIEINASAQRYFLLGGAAGFRALEVPMLSSLKYVNIMKPAFRAAARLEPSNVRYLRAQVDVLVALPPLLGGSITDAQEYVNKIQDLNLLEGLMAEGSLHEKTENLEGAKKVFKQVFSYLTQTYAYCTDAFIDDLKSNRRDLAYDLGRIAADYNLNVQWGQCALSYFEKTHGFRDTVPIAWVYYQKARLAKKAENQEEMNLLITKAQAYQKDFPALENLLNQLKS